MAIGNSKDTAKAAGINITRNTIGAYMICGALTGLGGLLSAGQIGAIPSTFGIGNEFAVISATVLGGTSLFGGKANIIPGALLGIVLVTSIMNGLAMMDASSYVYSIVSAVIIFIAVMFDSINYTGQLR
jgi:ribose transport system permease protein